MVKAVSHELILAQVSALRLLGQQIDEEALRAELEELLKVILGGSRDRCRRRGQDDVRGDFLGACWTLVCAELSREHEEAVVAHQVLARLQQDQLHRSRHLVYISLVCTGGRTCSATSFITV